MRRAAVVLALLAVVAGCGQNTKHSTAPRLTRPLTAAQRACPAAQNGQGYMGACGPVRRFQLAPPLAPGTITWPDRSNNDPTLSFAAIRRHGHPAADFKVNQGTGFVDGWFAPMNASARRAGLATGGYDFVSSYSVAEAQLFVARLHAEGMTRASARWLPPTLDIEYAFATRAGVQQMVNIVRAAFSRVMIYTGAWYWTPHLGCWWPAGVIGWISGYPQAVVPCGLPRSLYRVHQYTDNGFDGAGPTDMNVWLGSPTAFRAFARIMPAPAPIHRPDRNRLLHRYHIWRAHLRRVLARFGCRHGRRRHETRPINCLLALRRGDHVNQQIRALLRRPVVH